MAVDVGVEDHGREGHSCVLYKNEMFIFGGIKMNDNGESETNSLLSYDLNNKKWTDYSKMKYKEMPLARSGHTACVYNNAMYIYGGVIRSRDKDDRLQWQPCNQLWKFDLSNATNENAWTLMEMNKFSHNLNELKSAPTRHRHSVVLYESFMIIIGGLNDDAIKDDTVSKNIDTQNAVCGILIIDLSNKENKYDCYYLTSLGKKDSFLTVKDTRVRHTCNIIHCAKDISDVKVNFNLTLAVTAGEDYIKFLQSDVMLIECKLLNFDNSEKKFTLLDVLINGDNWNMIDKFAINLDNGKVFDRFGHTSVALLDNQSATLFVYGGYGNSIMNDCYFIQIKYDTNGKNDKNDKNDKNKEKEEMKSNNENIFEIGNFSINCISLNPKKQFEKRHGHTSVFDSKNNQIIHFGGKKNFVQMAQNNGEIQRVVIEMNEKAEYGIKDVINDSGKEINSGNAAAAAGVANIENQMDAWAKAEEDELQQILLMSMMDK